jgi:protein O-mannosyl-transferase
MAPESSAPAPRIARILKWAVPLLLFVIPFAAFFPCLSNGFVDWDDNVYFWENPSLGRLGTAQFLWAVDSAMGRLATPPGGEAGTVFQPVSWWILEGQVAAFGVKAFPIHLVSLVFYSANAVLFYFLIVAFLRRCQPELCRQRPVLLAIAAGLAAAIHVLHPLRAEVVAWAAAQPYLPANFLMMLTVLAYLKAFETATPSRKLLGLAVVSYLLALLAKPLAVAIPPILLLLDFYPLRRVLDDAEKLVGRRLARVVIEKTVLAVPAVFAMLAAVHLRYGLVPLEQDGIAGRVMQIGHSVWFYLIKTVVPTGLSHCYFAPAQTPWRDFAYLGATIAVFAVSFLLLLWARKRPGLLVAWFSFLLLLAPTIGIYRTSEYVVADRYSYVPMQAAAVLLAAAILYLGHRLALLSPSRLVLAVGSPAAVLLCVWAVMSWQQSQVWVDSISLRTQGVRYGGAQSASLNTALGTLLLSDDRVEEGMTYLERATELDPDYVDGHKVLGIALMRKRRYEWAIPHLKQAVASRPGDAELQYLLGFALAKTNRIAEAEGPLAQAACLNPNDGETARMYGLVLFCLHRYAAAETALTNAARLSPDRVEIRDALGELLACEGKWIAAVQEYREAVRLQPDDQARRLKLARALIRAGTPDLAAGEIEMILRAQPNNAEAKRGLAEAVDQQKVHLPAVSH